MIRPGRTVRPLLIGLAFAALALGVSACGYSSDSKDVVEGEPVTLEGVQYNVVFSRFLNPNDSEDSAYLVQQAPAPAGSSYFGVFLEAKNEDDGAKSLPQSFTITDADHRRYESIPSTSLYAFPLGGEVEADEQIPVLDSTPQQGSIEGSLVLFLLPETASQNRPLVLYVEGSEGGQAEVTLDL